MNDLITTAEIQGAGFGNVIKQKSQMTQLSLNLSELKREWIETASPIVLSTMRGREFTSDDLHEVLTEPAHVNWFGVLIARLANKGLVERIGCKASQRKESNGRLISIWTVKPTTLQPA